MILADTSVWVAHFHHPNDYLARLLDGAKIICHPFVIGEVALGDKRQRMAMLQYLSDLPRCIAATDAEVLSFITSYALFGRGIGYIDAHLLASVRITPECALWTLDKRLHDVSQQLGLAMKAN